MKKAKYFLIYSIISVSFFTEEISFSEPLEEEMSAEEVLAQLSSYVLPQFHFSHRSLDDDYSRALFQEMLFQLDSDKQFFMASDVEALSQEWETFLDDALQNGDLTFLNDLKGFYKKRVEEYLANVPLLLQEPMDFTAKEFYETDSRKLLWAKDESELQDRWRKRLQFQVLQLKISKMRHSQKVEEVLSECKAEVLKDLQERNKYFHQTLLNLWDIFMDAMATVFDSHSEYFSPKEEKQFQEHMNVSFEGIGVGLHEKEGEIRVTYIIVGGPADRQGELQEDDVLIAVGEGDEEPTNIVGMAIDEVITKIKGKKGTVVSLTIRRPKDNSMKVIRIVRDRVPMEEQKAKAALFQWHDLKFGYLKLPSFYAGKDSSSAFDVARLLELLNKQSISGLVFDLRNNGGGATTEAVAMVGYFIKQGPVVQIKDSNKRVRVGKDPSKKLLFDKPLVILVNPFSASASEIFVAALQDYGRAIVMGQKTHGKGTAQQIIPLDHFLPKVRGRFPAGGALKMTMAKFYRITGRSTQLKGVIPDIELPGLWNGVPLGEEDNPHHLLWDEISPTSFKRWERHTYPIEFLKTRSQERVAGHPYFENVRIRNKIYLRTEQETRISLNEEENILQRQKIEEAAREGRHLRRLRQLRLNVLTEEEYQNLEKNDEMNKGDNEEKLFFQKKLRQIPPSQREEWKKRALFDEEVEESFSILEDFLTYLKQIAQH